MYIELHESESFFSPDKMKEQYEAIDEYIEYHREKGRDVSVGVHVPFEHFDLADPDPVSRRIAIEDAKKCIEIAGYARSSGASSVYVVMHAYGDMAEKGRYLEIMKESVRELLPLAEKYDVNLRYENCYGNYIASSPDDLRAVIDGISHPRFGFILDLSHWMLAYNIKGGSEDFVLDRFLELSPDYFHVSDADGVIGEGLLIGEGEIDWDMVKEGLDRLKHDRDIILTSEAKSQHLLDYAGMRVNMELMEKVFRRE